MQPFARRYGAIIKHGIIVSILTLISAVGSYKLLLPLAKDDILGIIQTSLGVSALLVGIYFGLTVFLLQKSLSENEPSKL